ncbi:unnamed protein product [Auanema sp. JU1783]|nr:unnamed protein product [Auanema sp. JU1783]
MFMDHVNLQNKIREFEIRIRKWRQLRFGFAEPVVHRRSASQEPHNNNSVSVQSSPAHRTPISNVPIGCRTTPMQRRDLGLDLPKFQNARSPEQQEIERRYQAVRGDSGKLTIKGETKLVSFEELTLEEEIGNGSCGQVSRYTLGNVVMAIKQMARTNNPDENKRIIMDLDVVTKTKDCPNIVLCYGYFIHDYDVYVCMEIMATCLDRLLKKTKTGFPEKVIGKMAVSILSALSYLKDNHNVIHRDIKPSNILIDWSGTIKLCDFGISGQLVESQAHSRQGCPPYMAPERLSDTVRDYDIRSDVWSFGITLVELATGKFPYAGSGFEMLTSIIQSPSPSLPAEFSPEFRSFVDLCLTKDVKKRPKYNVLKNEPFIKNSIADRVTDVGSWFESVYTI